MLSETRAAAARPAGGRIPRAVCEARGLGPASAHQSRAKLSREPEQALASS